MRGRLISIISQCLAIVALQDMAMGLLLVVPKEGCGTHGEKGEGGRDPGPEHRAITAELKRGLWSAPALHQLRRHLTQVISELLLGTKHPKLVLRGVDSGPAPGKALRSPSRSRSCVYSPSLYSGFQRSSSFQLFFFYY